MKKLAQKYLLWTDIIKNNIQRNRKSKQTTNKLTLRETVINILPKKLGHYDQKKKVKINKNHV